MLAAVAWLQKRLAVHGQVACTSLAMRAAIGAACAASDTHAAVGSEGGWQN